MNADGTRGLVWREEVSADVFERASVDAAAALKNYRESATGARNGHRVGFPHFSAKHPDTQRFRLRAKCRPGESPPVRFTSPRSLVAPKLGELRISGSGNKVARMIAAGRFHVYSDSFTYSAGRWFVALTGVAAELQPARRSPKGRHLEKSLIGAALGELGASSPAKRPGRAPSSCASSASSVDW